MLQDVLGARPPVMGPQVSEDADEGRDNKRILAAVDRFLDSEANHALGMRRINVDDIVRSVPRNGIEEILNEATMRIDHRETAAVVKIAKNHVAHERGFPDTGFAEDRHVLAASVAIN